MQPYVNPYYLQQQQYNNYQNPYGGYQQQSFQQLAPGMVSKVVNAFEEITANDVPMDGTQAMFMKRDGSEIQVRAWNSNGQIVSTSYKPILDKAEEKANTLSFDAETFKNDVLDELTGLFDDRFAKLEKIIKPTRTKKESVADE